MTKDNIKNKVYTKEEKENLRNFKKILEGKKKF